LFQLLQTNIPEKISTMASTFGEITQGNRKEPQTHSKKPFLSFFQDIFNDNISNDGTNNQE